MTTHTARTCATSLVSGLVLATAVQADPQTPIPTSIFTPVPFATSAAGLPSEAYFKPQDLPVIASLLLSPGVGAYAKFSHGRDWSTTGGREQSDHGEEQVDWTYGAGLQYQLTPDWSLSADWDQFKLRSSDTRNNDVSRYSVGTRYRF